MGNGQWSVASAVHAGNGGRSEADRLSVGCSGQDGRCGGTWPIDRDPYARRRVTGHLRPSLHVPLPSSRYEYVMKKQLATRERFNVFNQKNMLS